MNHFSRQAALCGLMVLTGPVGWAWAEARATYDPAQLPTFHGKVVQYDLSPHGDIDGVILDSGLEVHTSPHQSTEVAATIRPGDVVTIHGLKARELSLVRARSLTNDTSAATVVDNEDSRGAQEHGHDDEHEHHRGPHRGGGRGAPGEVQGKIKMQLHDPDGDVDGVLLTDGTIVHFPSQTATTKAAQLAPGQNLFVQGDVNVSDLGKLVNARALGSSAGEWVPVPEAHGR
jgi:hypothetical protein